ncbi:MAG: type II toxin-antitoxin system VapC family toxin [Deltaproteobacteria bacterium]|nr:type II toxin-antitoxin system VapC family toxin [Deltaproteobacteria bacterium]
MTSPTIMIDTNIVSYLMRGRAEAHAYAQHLQGKLLAISFVTVGELFYGAEKARWGHQRRMKLETTLRNFLVIPYDYEIAKNYARILADCDRQGRPISSNDAWIAACAMRHTVPLVTHNAKDFETISGLKLITETEVRG